MKRRSIFLIAIVSILIFSLSVPAMADKMPKWLQEEYFGKSKKKDNYNNKLDYAEELTLGKKITSTQDIGLVRNWYYLDVDEKCYYRFVFEGYDSGITVNVKSCA